MAEFVLRYADPRGQMHEQVADAPTEREARERLRSRAIWSTRFAPKDLSARLGSLGRRAGRRSILKSS